jgi:hypothetical protein
MATKREEAEMVKDGVLTVEPLYLLFPVPKLIFVVWPLTILCHWTDVWVGVAVTTHSNVMVFPKVKKSCF